MIRQSSSRIELELQGVRTAIEDLEATSLEQRVLLDRTISQAANQGAILDALYDKLQRFPGLTTSLVDGRSITAPPSTPFLPFPYGNAVPEQDPYWSTSVALHLAQPHPGSCKCSCHRQKRIRSPPLLKRIFGALFVGYVGLPTFSATCGFRNSCCKHVDLKGSVIYMFPAWFTALIVIAKVQYLQNHGPQMLIRCQRVLPNSSPIFQATAMAKWGLVESLIKGGKASILDVTDQGISVLSVSKPTMSAVLIIFHGLIPTANRAGISHHGQSRSRYGKPVLFGRGVSARRRS